MIEVFPEKDYNILNKECTALGASVRPDSEGMLLREDGRILGAALWVSNGVTADIYYVTAPDRYGAYYDMCFRSALNHLLTRAEKLTVCDDSDFYIPLGFTRSAGCMSANITDIKFPHNCN